MEAIRITSKQEGEAPEEGLNFYPHLKVAVVTKRGHVDWPFFDFRTGKIAWDFPGRVPKYMKEAVENFYNSIPF